MGKFCVLLFVLSFFFVSFAIAQMNSSNYDVDFDVLTGAGGNLSSGSYSSDVVAGILTGLATSSNYIGELGVFFEENILPSLPVLVFNSSFGTNLTSENLTVYISGSVDENGDEITNITDWRKDGESIAVLNMPFDSNGGSVAKDYSTFGNNGSVVGASFVSSGKIGGAMSFDGDGDYINCGDDASFNVSSSRSISAWIKTDATGTSDSSGTIVARVQDVFPYDGFVLNIGRNTAGRLAYYSNGWVESTSTNYNSNDWIHVVIIHNSTGIFILKNAVFDGVHLGEPISNHNSNLYIGRERTNQNRYFNGSIDEIKIYNYSLSVEQVAADYQAGLDNHSVEKIVSQETNNGDTWSVKVTPNDGVGDGVFTLSENLVIGNSLPVVTLTGPSDWNATFNRTPELSWSGYDSDGDDLTYEILIEENYFSGDGTSCDDYRNENDLSLESYVPSSDLNCLHDNGYYYEWSVRANDGTGWGDWSDVWHFNLTAEVSISLAFGEMDFGSLGPGDIENSSDGSPSSFIIDNDGNVLTNISLNSSALWTEEQASSSYYQFKVDNVSGEEGSFAWLLSIVDWFDMPITGEVVGVGELSYPDGDDSVEVDIRLEVPLDESPGIKNATIVFKGGLAE